MAYSLPWSNPHDPERTKDGLHPERLGSFKTTLGTETNLRVLT